MNTYKSSTAYWYGYEAALTGKAKPQSNKYQKDIDLGYGDGRQDLHKQMLEAFQEGTVQ